MSVVVAARFFFTFLECTKSRCECTRSSSKSTAPQCESVPSPLPLHHHAPDMWKCVTVCVFVITAAVSSARVAGKGAISGHLFLLKTTWVAVGKNLVVRGVPCGDAWQCAMCGRCVIGCTAWPGAGRRWRSVQARAREGGCCVGLASAARNAGRALCGGVFHAGGDCRRAIWCDGAVRRRHRSRRAAREQHEKRAFRRRARVAGENQACRCHARHQRGVGMHCVRDDVFDALCRFGAPICASEAGTASAA